MYFSGESHLPAMLAPALQRRRLHRFMQQVGGEIAENMVHSSPVRPHSVPVCIVYFGQRCQGRDSILRKSCIRISAASCLRRELEPNGRLHLEPWACWNYSCAPAE
ncbi:hypothetical protein PsYK624_114400 [Phanerochaete sordida]|uniref:Uncharacterized protein n=1 Tax=Phanerochaete sordida TaxID=48140 RepID=A0A9P3GGM5_9APHY|nr:hypothetical protein PsYK624_114400 [Phanerochaete sordida]